jgi:tungstate transport system ATP-binding protein
MDPKILEIINLKKKFQSGFEIYIGHLTVRQNSILVIIGPNGSGKSTLIKLIDLLEKPDSGIITFDGTEITESESDKAAVRKRISVVFQEPLLFNISVYSNILLGLNLRKKNLSGKKFLFEYLIAKLDIRQLLYRNPKSLSGGEQQRVALARALILEPELLLLDEPLANIDQPSREKLRNDLFSILKDIRRSTIYVTHDRNEAMLVADEIAVMNNGKIEQTGIKGDVFSKPANEFVAKFVGVEALIEGRVTSCADSVFEVTVKRADDKNSGTETHPKIYAAGNTEISEGDNVMAAIRPEDVTIFNVSENPEVFRNSSALNFFSGKVISIEDIGFLKKIEIDCGFRMVSFITRNSVERMGLAAGKEVGASVKASSIHIFKR